MQGKKHYHEKLFVHFQLSNVVPEDNFYRRLKHILDLNFIYEKTKHYYGNEGQKSIDPVVFIKLMLIGYFENLNSDRRIIDHSRMRLDILYFIGYDIDEPLPWHSTLSRTRQLYGEEIFLEMFRRVLSLCVKAGMVGGKRQALDSAYIKANASMDSLKEKPELQAIEEEVMQDAVTYSKELKANEDENGSTNNKEEEGPQDKSKRVISSEKKKEVEAHHRWKEETYKAQPKGRSKSSEDTFEDEREEDEQRRGKYVSNHTHYSSTDPDSRVSTKPGKARALNYTAQTSVDTLQHVITNINADYSDKRDSECLATAVNKTEANLQPYGMKIEELLADAGYSSGSALKYLEFKGITGYIPNFGQYKPHREGFRYDKAKDQYECERGNKALLPYKRTLTDSKGYTKRIYRSDNSKCKDCPLRTTCIGKSDFKKIEDSIDKPYYDRMYQRLQTRKAKIYKKLRSATVEPVLGTLINFLGLRRIRSRGIGQANKIMLGAATAYNLKKWIKYVMRKSAAPTQQTSTNIITKAKKAAKSLLKMFTEYSTLYSGTHIKIYTAT